MEIFPPRGWVIDIHESAAGLGMSRQAQGSIASVVPGDMLIFGGGHVRLDDGRPAGHVAVVDTVSVNADGSSTINTLNQNTDVAPLTRSGTTTG